MRFLKIFISLIGLTLLSKILGFFRELMLSFYYGTSNITDAYLVALTIPGVLFSFFSIAISVSFIPVFSKISDDIAIRNKFINNIFSILLLISTIIVFITIIFAENFVFICAPGFDQLTKDLAVKFTRIFVLGVYFSCWLAIFCAFLNFFKKFTLVALAGIPFNISILLSIFLSYHYGLTWLILGAIFGKIFEIIYLYPHVKKLNYKFQPIIDFKDKHAKQMFFLALPLMLSVAVNQINIIVDKSIASTLEVGAISAINYSHYLIELIIGIFVLTVTTIFFPDLARSFNNKNFSGIKEITEKSFSIVNLFVIPSFIFFIFQSKNIISFIYERGSFDGRAVELTASAFLFFSIGLIGLSYKEVLSRIYYAMHNTKIPVFNSIIGVVVNIILAIFLSKNMGMGVAGLALATSISAFLTAFLLIISLNKIQITLNYRKIFLCFIKKNISAIFSILCILIFIDYLFLPLILFIYFSLYIFILFLLRDESVFFYINQLCSRIKK